MRKFKVLTMVMLTLILVLGTMGNSFATTDWHTLTLVADPSEGGSVTGGGLYHWSHEPRITATPNEGYRFVMWTGDRVGDPYDSSQRIDMPNNDLTITAHFELKNYDLIVSSAGNGTVTGTGEFTMGSSAPVTATPDPGYYFVKWVINVHGDGIGAYDLSEPKDFTYMMPAHDVDLVAYFAEIPELSILVAPDVDPALGSVTGSSGGPILPGETVVLTAVPSVERAIIFTGWSFEPSFSPTSDEDGVLTFDMPMNDLEITAHFEELDLYNVRLFAVPEDKGNPELDENALPGDVGFDGAYYDGENFQVMPNPVPHWHFVGFDVAYLSEMPPLQFMSMMLSEYDYTDLETEFMIDGSDMEITVYYEEDPYVWATPHYVDTEGDPLQDPGDPIKVYLDEPYSIPHPASIGSYLFAYTLNDNDEGTVYSESEYGDFDVYFYYYLPEVVTNTVTNTVTETIVVTVPAPTEAPTEAITEEVVPLGTASTPFNFDSIYDNMEMPTEEVIAEEETPLADALPQTGQIPVELFYGIGGMLTAIGAYMKRKK